MAVLFDLSIPSLAFAFTATFAAYVFWRALQKRSGLPYPPGPKGYPLIGNLLDIPSDFGWLTFKKYAEQYGRNGPL
jgi:hypothetical protein